MCDGCGWEGELSRIRDMLDDPDCEFALETLSGIAAWVEDHEHITDRQVRAVDNIDDAAHRDDVLDD